jgi:hypothetical protein
MEPKDLQKNSMMLRMDILPSGDLKIYSAQHFGDDITDEEARYYEALLTGLNYALNFGTDFCVGLGTMVLELGEMEAEEEFIFEPDEELKQAVADAKVIKFNKDKMN